MSIAVTQLNTVKFKWTQWQITRHFTHFFSVRFFAGILDFTDLYVCVLTCFWKWLDCRTYTKQIDFNSGLWFELWLYFFFSQSEKNTDGDWQAKKKHLGQDDRELFRNILSKIHIGSTEATCILCQCKSTDIPIQTSNATLTNLFSMSSICRGGFKNLCEIRIWEDVTLSCNGTVSK